MDVLANKQNDDLPIFRAFCERTLKSHAQKMEEAQKKRMTGFSGDFWEKKSFRTTENSLFYNHLPVHRFNDMKALRGKGGFESGGKKYKRKNYEIHNRIIMGHYNGIQLDLTYGLTDQVKDDLRAQFAGKNIDITF